MNEKPRAVLKKPYEPAKLDPEEAALSRSFSTDEWKEVEDPASRQQAQDAARAAKSERTNIRLSEADLAGIRLKASERGMGYQTLIASLVHRYVSGTLVEMDPAVIEVAARATQMALGKVPGASQSRPATSGSGRKAVGLRKKAASAKRAHG